MYHDAAAGRAIDLSELSFGEEPLMVLPVFWLKKLFKHINIKTLTLLDTKLSIDNMCEPICDK